MRIDHVTVAGADLEVMRRRFAEIGLATDYGGPHANGVTHMALLGFDDGSYLELISTLTRGATSPLWDPQIHDSAGPAAWAVVTDDLELERARLEALGISATGPVPMTRTRPDGRVLAWELLVPGEGPAGATLPFSIRDQTPRSLRVRPSASVSGSGLGGVAGVVIGVKDLAAPAALFSRAYTWTEPCYARSSTLGATLAWFTGTPVVLAEPESRSGWLAERVSRYGDAPAAFLLTNATALTNARAPADTRLPLLPAEQWFGRRLAWIDPAVIFGWRLGLLSAQ